MNKWLRDVAQLTHQKERANHINDKLDLRLSLIVRLGPQHICSLTLTTPQFLLQDLRGTGARKRLILFLTEQGTLIFELERWLPIVV